MIYHLTRNRTVAICDPKITIHTVPKTKGDREVCLACANKVGPGEQVHELRASKCGSPEMAEAILTGKAVPIPMPQEVPIYHLTINGRDSLCDPVKYNGGTVQTLPEPERAEICRQCERQSLQTGIRPEILKPWAAQGTPREQRDRLDAEWLTQVSLEIDRARQKHGPKNSAHEAYAVILEEVDEFWDEVKKQRGKRNRAMAVELVQIAAAAVLALTDLDLHEQSAK